MCKDSTFISRDKKNIIDHKGKANNINYGNFDDPFQGASLDTLELTEDWTINNPCLLYTSPSPRDRTRSRMPSSA